MKTLSLLRRAAILQHQVRYFGPKPKAAGGGAAEPYVPPPSHQTNFERMIEENGTDQFLFGPPSGITKKHQTHRDYAWPKAGQRIEMVAKKFREQYIREAHYPDVKIFLDPLRER